MSEAQRQDQSQQRIEELEARVRWLEGALTSVLQERRAQGRGQQSARPGTVFTLDDFAPDLPQDKTQPLETVTARPAAPPDADAMRFTNSFATLDQRLRDQLEAESAAQASPDMAPPVLIDPELIDRAFARPLPARIEVRSALEESYPHLMERILATWRAPESAAFLRKLIVDDRGDRQGFPFEVMSELLVLSAMAEAPRA